nr:predicted protein [Triticum aestivum]BDI54628.1 predicted protein [Triticum aestivum]
MERLRRLSSFVLAYEAEEKDYDAPEQPGRRRVSFDLTGEAEKEEAECRHAPEKEAECRHAPEKEAECRHVCPNRHSPEEEAVEEVECPDSPEEEEEAEASSSEG